MGIITKIIFIVFLYLLALLTYPLMVIINKKERKK